MRNVNPAKESVNCLEGKKSHEEDRSKVTMHPKPPNVMQHASSMPEICFKSQYGHLISSDLIPS